MIVQSWNFIFRRISFCSHHHDNHECF